MVVPIGAAVSTIPLGWGAALATLVVTGAVAFALAARASAVVSVTEGPQGPEFRAGRARIPCGLLGRVSTHRGQNAHEERGIRLHPHAYLVLRGWIPDLVRVDINDDADPTPYWLVSSRHPDGLAAAIEEGRARALR